MIAKRAAPEIDRLVFAVHRRAARRSAAELRSALGAAGMDSLSALNALGELLRAGELTRESAALRYRYWPAAELGGFLSESIAAGNLSQEAGRFNGSAAVLALIDVAQQARAGAAAELWGGHRESVDEVIALSREVLAASGPSPLLDAFAGVPLPEPAEHRLFAVLERLRYLRNDAHAAAWMAAGLAAADMVELTPIWNGQEPKGEAAALASLETRGLVKDGALTERGQSIRDSVEDETNRLAQPAFDVLGARGDRFIELLTDLPSET